MQADESKDDATGAPVVAPLELVPWGDSRSAFIGYAEWSGGSIGDAWEAVGRASQEGRALIVNGCSFRAYLDARAHGWNSQCQTRNN